jgi:membrane peptidoglycan carboxypeptidase
MTTVEARADDGTTPEPPSSARRRKRRRRRLAGGATALVLLVAIGTAVLFSVTPSVSDAPDRVRGLATAHSADPLATAVPQRISAAILAVEDHRFYRHHGVDTLALPRAFNGTVTGNDRGGSTIEIQLAKWLYTGGRRNHVAQTEQVALAFKLNVRYTKSEILLMYLNTVHFGHGFYGITAACRGYFGISPDQVSWAQAALLAGVLKAPNAYDPLIHPAAALDRRSYAISRLAAVGTITPAERADADRAGLQLIVP